MEPTLAPEVPTETPPEKKRYRIFAYLGIGLGLLVSWVRSWAWSYGLVSAEMIGHFVGSLLPPALIAYLIAGRKSVRNFNRFAVFFSWLCILFSLFTPKPSVDIRQHVGDLMKEAAGTKPVDDSGPRTLDDLIRTVMGDALEQRKTLERETSQFTPDLERLYSADSFSSPDKMKRSLDAVRGVVEADRRYSQKIEDLPKRVEERVRNSQLPESDKKAFMEGIQESLGSLKALAIRKEAMEVENQWAEVTVRLYEFTLSSPGKIKVSHGQLIARTEQDLAELNRLLEKSQSLQGRLVTLNAQLDAAQRDALKQVGVTPKEIGLPEGQPVSK